MMLRLDSVESGYGASQVLFGVSLEIDSGDVVTLLGRNGMGKTTTVRTIMGLNPASAGRIVFEGRDIAALPPFVIARLGLGLVPEGRQIFPNLTVEENLLATAMRPGAGGDGWDLVSVYSMFPPLRERREHMGNQLSGGEQQMLAIARALMTNPRLLILDEATEGLAPLVRAEIWRCLGMLRERRQAILVIDKDLGALTRIADRHYIMDKGLIAWSGDSAALLADPGLGERYLGVQESGRPPADVVSLGSRTPPP